MGKQASKIKEGEAIFHEFGVDHEECSEGPLNFSTAIIELPDGTIKNIYVELIKFIHPIE